MTPRYSIQALLIGLILTACAAPVAAQQYVTPFEFMLYPVAFEWRPCSAQDLESVTTAGRMRLNGAVKSLKTDFYYGKLQGAGSGPRHWLTIEQQFDRHGNLDCSHIEDHRTGLTYDSIYLTTYNQVAGHEFATQVQAAMAFSTIPGIAPSPLRITSVAKFSYDASGRMASAKNLHAEDKREVRYERSEDGRLIRLRKIPTEHDGDVIDIDTQGRVLSMPSMAVRSDLIDARWTQLLYVDWVYDPAQLNRRAWVCFDNRGAPIDWEIPILGPWVRFHQTLEYDQFGNWTSLMVDLTGIKKNSVQVDGQPMWGMTRRIEYFKTDEESAQSAPQITTPPAPE